MSQLTIDDFMTSNNEYPIKQYPNSPVTTSSTPGLPFQSGLATKLKLPNSSNIGGLAESGNNSNSIYDGIMADRKKITDLELKNKNLLNEQEGPSRWAADASAIGSLAFSGLAAMENRKTMEIQRDQMKQNLRASADFNQGRKDRAASWSRAMAKPAREINA
jgi:hypothetical protein